VLVTHDEGAVHALEPDRVLILPDGVEDLWSAIEEHRAFLAQDGRLAARRREGLHHTLRTLALGRLGRTIDREWGDDEMAELVSRVESRAVDPDGAVDEILARLRDHG